MKDEFEFISRITPNVTHQSSLVIGIGDDAAVYHSTADMDEVVCVDTMVEGIHFRRDTLSPFQIGRKALVANISDLCAMGATPLYYLVSIAIPSSWSDTELDEVYQGMMQLGDDYCMDLIGGDTVSTSDVLVLSVTVIGRVERGRKLFRNQAQPGDVVFVSGTVGGSAAGLQLIFDRGLNGSFSEAERQLVLAHQEPTAQLEAGRILATSMSRIALNDVSDGVASETNEIAEASNVKIILDLDRIPLHPAMEDVPKQRQLDWALFGGEDFQLIGTVDKDRFPQLEERCKAKGILLSAIGEVQAGEAAVYGKQGTKIIQLHKQGFNHFK